jgi:putative membrane protein
MPKAERSVLIFTAAYMVAFAIYFLSIGNREFLWYISTMLVLIALVALSRKKGAYPTALLWALTIWGLAHMAGGGVRVGEGVLYSLVLLPLASLGDFAILKYDQVVHAYGFGVTAWLLWHLLNHNFPALKDTKTLYVFPVLASMGLGATNEIIEFIAVVTFPNTNVGGYYNTALDLIFNTLGAMIAMVIVRHSVK